MANTSYGRLFKSTPHPATTSAATDSGGPAAIAEPKQASAQLSGEGDENLLVSEQHWKEKLHFAFAPDLSSLVNPRKEDLVGPRVLSPVTFRQRLTTIPWDPDSAGGGYRQARDSQRRHLCHADTSCLCRSTSAAGHSARRSQVENLIDSSGFGCNNLDLYPLRERSLV